MTEETGRTTVEHVHFARIQPRSHEPYATSSQAACSERGWDQPAPQCSVVLMCNKGWAFGNQPHLSRSDTGDLAGAICRQSATGEAMVQSCKAGGPPKLESLAHRDHIGP